jgi:hypothetical protein
MLLCNLLSPDDKRRTVEQIKRRRQRRAFAEHSCKFACLQPARCAVCRRGRAKYARIQRAQFIPSPNQVPLVHCIARRHAGMWLRRPQQALGSSATTGAHHLCPVRRGHLFHASSVPLCRMHGPRPLPCPPRSGPGSAVGRHDRALPPTCALTCSSAHLESESCTCVSPLSAQHHQPPPLSESSDATCCYHCGHREPASRECGGPLCQT